ncbi:FAD/FMN-containing isoamyl alcohol oxidase MreA [Neofusicoccum parvum]|uniref:FAD/FMN-containing isoamyl alcohol oxidase MreA n=1 Tax=Neofusicoccum parvum TaxID=310453 RepID=A0ACB5S7T0_9PEZI|nr:FAD/FMN-containing isoamyl alcohol oxidase MreA [Neofusicoccum parvum]
MRSGPVLRQAALNALVWSAQAAESAQSCRCFPGDACWPAASEWQALNETVGGRLVATVPLAAPCHDPVYDASTCQTLRDNWLWPQQHYDSSSSIMAPFFANRSCDPFAAEDSPCVLGTYVRYAINVSTTEDVAAGVRFAKEKNIRLVIRNTGHDYNGKSTGAGSLAIWTHHLKDISIIDYSSATYSGKAIKLGSGVQGGEAYVAADAAGLAVVGGECPTVGIAGGYSQGGGHSALASKYGLAADQVLEWEVVDGTGEVLVANRQENSDLYWALSGGGGGTYGVVTSMTSKAHEDIPVAGANLTFSAEGLTADTYYEAVGAWHTALPKVVDAGAMVVWYFTNTSFSLSPITAPGVSAEDLTALLQPYLDKLDELNITYSTYIHQFPGYYAQFSTMQSPIQVGIAQYGGWLVPRSVVETNNDALTAAYRNITEDGAIFIGVGLNVSKAVAGDVDNAVLPAWRDTLIDTVITTPWNFTAPWEEMIEWQDKMTDNYIPQLTALAPESGAYLNEADFRQPNWQTAFYGSNYEKLREIKAKYDPSSVFYALGAVGSDDWEVEEDGRLCSAEQGQFVHSDFQRTFPDL